MAPKTEPLGSYDLGYDEARVETLNELVRVLNDGGDIRERIQRWHDKLDRNARVPEGFELVRLV